MEHPAYNTWTYREKLAMFEVRVVIAKLFIASVFLLFFLALYFTLSTCILLAIPLFYDEHSTLLKEQWKNNTGCLSPPASNMVILNCLHTDFTIDEHAFLNETIARTLFRLTDDDPHIGYLLNNILSCHDDDGWCRTCIFIVLDELARNPTTVFLLSLLSATLTLLTCVLSHGPAPHYFRTLRAHLTQSSAEGIKFDNMSSKQKDEYLHALASPEQTPTVKPPEFPSHEWTMEDEADMMTAVHEEEERKSIANGLRYRSGPILPIGSGGGVNNAERPRMSLL